MPFGRQVILFETVIENVSRVAVGSLEISGGFLMVSLNGSQDCLTFQPVECVVAVPLSPHLTFRLVI